MPGWLRAEGRGADTCQAGRSFAYSQRPGACAPAAPPRTRGARAPSYLAGLALARRSGSPGRLLPWLATPKREKSMFRRRRGSEGRGAGEGEEEEGARAHQLQQPRSSGRPRAAGQTGDEV